MKYSRPLKYWDPVFESHLRHGCMPSCIYFCYHSCCVDTLYSNYLLHGLAFRPLSGMRIHCWWGVSIAASSECARNRHEAGRNENLVWCLVYSFTLRVEATCSSETSADFERTTWRCMPDDRTRHNRRCENHKSFINHYLYTSEFLNVHFEAQKCVCVYS
jgi:hypothetical protein